MKHERGLNVLKAKNFPRSVLCEAIAILEVLMDEIIAPNEAAMLRQIASLWCDGLSWNQISEELGLSPSEVRKYIQLAEELCSSAIMACVDDQFVEQEGLFGDVEDVTAKRIVKFKPQGAKYKKSRQAPLFSGGLTCTQA